MGSDGKEIQGGIISMTSGRGAVGIVVIGNLSEDI